MRHGLTAQPHHQLLYPLRMEKRQTEEMEAWEERRLIQPALQNLQEARETQEVVPLSQEQEEEERQVQWAQVRLEAMGRVRKTMALAAEVRLEELRQAEV